MDRTIQIRKLIRETLADPQIHKPSTSWQTFYQALYKLADSQLHYIYMILIDDKVAPDQKLHRIHKLYLEYTQNRAEYREPPEAN